MRRDQPPSSRWSSEKFPRQFCIGSSSRPEDLGSGLIRWRRSTGSSSHHPKGRALSSLGEDAGSRPGQTEYQLFKQVCILTNSINVKIVLL